MRASASIPPYIRKDSLVFIHLHITSMRKMQTLNELLLFTFSMTLLLPLASSSLNQQGLYLLRVKLSLTDPAGSLSTWSDRDATPCNWTGVTCNNEPFPSVVSLNLSGLSLSGPFPIVLCHLPLLSIIDFSNNTINSSIPSSISMCMNLTYLDLSQNLFVGPIPAALSNLSDLRYLNLQGNYLSGDIPSSFGNFRQLETLNLVYNQLNGTIPALLGNLTSLKSLQLAYNPFTSSQLAPEFGNLTNLAELWLCQCNLVGAIPVTFGKLSQLSNLDLSVNSLTGSVPSLIFELKRIVQIELYNNSLTGELPRGWSNLTQLKLFDASMNELTGIIPEELCELPLESLNLYENRFMGVIPESIANSPNLNELKLFGNQLTGSLPGELGKRSALVILDVSENKLTGEIPEQLCENGALEQLLLIYNSFSGNIPGNLGRCRTLRRVRLRGNRLSGEVPAEFWGLPDVYLLDLYDNDLSGSISSMIGGAKNLSNLVISKNRFSGPLPSEIGMLENLVEFLASHNNFTQEIPATIVHLRSLGRLVLDDNELSGELPSGIKSLQQLNELNLANNMLSGEIPGEIGSLPVLNYLDLSGNHISGSIPLELQNLKLNMLNLSNNLLSGDIPPLFANEVYRDSFLGNPGFCVNVNGLCPAKAGNGNQGYFWMLRLIFIIAGVLFLFGIVWFVWKYKNFRQLKRSATINWMSFHKLDFNEFELLNSLDEDHVIGSGSSSKVYKAVLSNGETVAVKKLRERLNKHGSGRVNFERHEFEAEVEMLGKIRHNNIVRLLCCSSSMDCKLLVYEYMPNGSLADLLHTGKGKLLDWPTRFRITLDSAKGLSYLHHDCVPPIVHRDVKSNNILLDAEFCAKISDFGVAKTVRAVNLGAESMSVVAGSCGYIAPEYAYTLRVNEKSDIYSFGIVILELVTGKPPVDPVLGEKDLATWVCTTLNQKGHEHVIDPNLDLSFKSHIYRVLDIGLLCTSPLPINRPSMRIVVKMLQESAAEKLNKWDQDHCKLIL